MIRLKRNQLVYKLFLALCILGSGIHVHAVEKTNTKANTQSNLGEKLIEAAKSGNEGAVQDLLSLGLQVNQSDVRLALAWAARERHEGIVRYLTGSKCPVKCRPTELVGALSIAASIGHEGIVQYLTSDECLVKPEQDNVGHALLSAAASGHERVVQHLLSLRGQLQMTPDNMEGACTSAAYHKHKSVINLLLDTRKMNSDAVKQVWDIVKDWDLKDLAEIHFPKEVYENSKELSHRLDQISEEELKAIMAIRTEDGKISPFTHYLLASPAKDKGWISQETANDFMSEQYHQDAMALMKLRQQGATKVSKLPKGVFRHMLGYTHPNIAGAGDGHGNQKESKEQDQTKKGGQQNDLGLID